MPAAAPHSADECLVFLLSILNIEKPFLPLRQGSSRATPWPSNAVILTAQGRTRACARAQVEESAMRGWLGLNGPFNESDSVVLTRVFGGDLPCR
jgi:hypothetical protein